MNSAKSKFVIIAGLLILVTSPAKAYIEHYPPYMFGDKMPIAPMAQLLSRTAYEEAYRLDLNADGLSDKVVFTWGNGAGLASMVYQVQIELKKADGSVQKISYETMEPDIRDFADLDGDRKSEVLITSYYPGRKHNYFSYSIFKFEGQKLVNANKQFKQFPKFIWLTDKPNDKNTVHLSSKEKQAHTQEIENSIHHS